MPSEHSSAPVNYRRILSIDGGGIRGVFPAAFLARLEQNLERPLGHYFDLIAGTSTGGIIAIGLGLGFTAREILQLYEEKGPFIFDQHRGHIANWLRQTARGLKQLLGSKYSSIGLRDALKEVLGGRRLGESTTRLLIPAWHPETERVYIFKTAHHERCQTDYRELALDAAMATAAAPTFFAPHLTAETVEFVDGGVWANNPIGVAAIEAVGVLGWRPESLKILSIGTISDILQRPRWGGLLPLIHHGYVAHLFMAGQSHSAMGTAKIVTGDIHLRKAIWRINQHASEGRYSMDSAARIKEMINRANVEAREQLPELRREFFCDLAEEFVPIYQLERRA